MPEPASAHEPYFGLAEPPLGADLDETATAARRCQACHLWLCGTQTVFGEGPKAARLMMIGEQPGDREDLVGRPFVGPAGKLLDKALDDAGIDRSDVYLTNVVKHFKWERSGGKRIHGKPNRKEVQACRPWLDSEIALVKPQAILLLGSTAAQALLGVSFRLTQNRQRFVESTLAPLVMATMHPSAILRAQDGQSRAEGYLQLVGDLRVLAEALVARTNVRLI